MATSPAPSPLTATTVKVYSVPLARPPIVHDNGSVSVGTVEQVWAGSTGMAGSTGVATTV